MQNQGSVAPPNGLTTSNPRIPVHPLNAQYDSNNKLSATSFSEEEIESAYRRFQSRFLEFKTYKVRNKSVFEEISDDDDDDEVKNNNASAKDDSIVEIISFPSSSVASQNHPKAKSNASSTIQSDNNQSDTSNKQAARKSISSSNNDAMIEEEEHETITKKRFIDRDKVAATKQSQGRSQFAAKKSTG